MVEQQYSHPFLNSFLVNHHAFVALPGQVCLHAVRDGTPAIPAPPPLLPRLLMILLEASQPGQAI